MALAFTIAGLQAELESFRGFLESRTWTSALDAVNRYRLTYAGLFASGSIDGANLTLAKPEELEALLDKTILMVDRLAAKTGPRTMIMRTSFPRKFDPIPLRSRQ